MYCTDGYSCKIHKTDDHEKCPKSRLDSTFQLLHEFNQTLFGGVHMRQIPLAPRSCWWKMNQMVSTKWTDGRGHAFTTLMIWQRVAVSPWSHEGSSDDRQKMLTVGNSQNTKLFGTQIDRVHFSQLDFDWGLEPWYLELFPLKPDCLIFCLIILLSPNRFPMQDSQQISSWHQPFELKSAAQWLAVQLTGSKEFLCFADVAEKMMPKTAHRPKSVPFLDLNETAQSSKTKTWWV